MAWEGVLQSTRVPIATISKEPMSQTLLHAHLGGEPHMDDDKAIHLLLSTGLNVYYYYSTCTLVYGRYNGAPA